MRYKAFLGTTALVIGTLAALTGCGWENTGTSIDSLLPSEPPSAAIEVDATEGVAPFQVTFDASESRTPGQREIVGYEWDFGDGETGSGVSVTHTYTEPGDYSVGLTVTNDRGAKDANSIEITVHPNEAPEAAFSISPRKPKTHETITFDASGSTDAAGLAAQAIVRYQWDFGDGRGGQGRTIEHRYADNGDYDVTLTLTDNGDKTTSLTRTISVRNRPPKASIETGIKGDSGSFQVDVDGAASSDPDGRVKSYLWDFGDGDTGSGKTTSHTYEEEGTFTIELTVTDDDGATATASADIELPPSSTEQRQPADDSGPQRYEGSGDDVISIDPPSKGPFLIKVSGNDEGRYFVINGYDAEGNVTGNFVATTQPYDGVTMDPSGNSVELAVMAPGSWVIEIRPLDSAQSLNLPDAISGSGATVFLVDGTPSAAQITGNQDGHYFSVEAFTAQGKRTALLVDSTDPYDGRVQVPEATAIIAVEAIGEWSMEFE